MNEETDTKQPKEIMESLEESTGLTGTPLRPAERIMDYYAKRWYDIGFRFAINYVYAHMLKTGRHDAEAFKEYLEDVLDIGVREDYFERNPFNVGDYPDGQCPGDAPGTCIQCSDPGIIPIDEITT